MRLLTFSGQGTPISIPVLKSVLRLKNAEFNKLAQTDKNWDSLLQFIFNNPSSPGSIAVCSNLYYQFYNSTLTGQQVKEERLLLGHSLGELTCLSVNGLFSIRDLFDIANYRNNLMVNYTKKYLIAHKLNYSTEFEMWALSSPKVSNLPNEIHDLLSKTNSMNSPFKSVSIANSNSVKQCVVTGLSEDLELLRTELHANFPRIRITELTNPNNIAFHNNNVLRSIQEPLHNFIWEILKKNKTHTSTQLEYPILANYDGRVSIMVHHAIERFVKASSNTVQFTKCYETIKSINEDPTLEHQERITDAICLGPGNVIYNLIKRNCTSLTPQEYSSPDTISSFEKAFAESTT